MNGTDILQITSVDLTTSIGDDTAVRFFLLSSKASCCVVVVATTIVFIFK